MVFVDPNASMASRARPTPPYQKPGAFRQPQVFFKQPMQQYTNNAATDPLSAFLRQRMMMMMKQRRGGGM